ncbi:MAG TPA: LCP family protein [Actinomycetota bacterium]|nr:LCP family protein [Actinomycetota bacterium]
MVRSVRTRERKRPRHRWQWVTLIVILSLLGAGLWGFWLYRSTLDDIQGPIGGLGQPPEEGQPLTTLLVGSDSRAGLSPREQRELAARAENVPGERADTLIVAHVDPATDRVMMVQFPRDLWVQIPGVGKDRVNSALLEGKTTLVHTVNRLTGLKINHYVQVNIAGFHDLVDAIGGVDVCIPEPIEFDEQTGLEVKEPGMVHFGADKAVRFVRSRKVFAGGDLARIQNQQKLLAAAIDKVTSLETFLNPVRIKRLVDTAGRNLRIDENTSLKDLYDIGQRLRRFDSKRYEAYTVPNLGPATVDGKSVILPDRAASKVLFDAIDRNESPASADGVPDIAPESITVGVYNGTSEDFAARRAARALERATDTGDGGVTIDADNVANADRFGYRRTIVRYDGNGARAARRARLVAAALPGAEVQRGDTDDDVDVAVIVGKRFRTERLVQIEALPIPEPGRLPEVCRNG